MVKITNKTVKDDVVETAKAMRQTMANEKRALQAMLASYQNDNDKKACQKATDDLFVINQKLKEYDEFLVCNDIKTTFKEIMSK